ncbi:hypothetical protein GHT06_020514 [Daphnia sinensis]|uniref:Uncharacterized protein n=1 Tax=Daphnia sinensis TaxID=1820382 RepID=A0AAD5PP71_9CRUS|nr:hypothetical protein GHT06_020514 [Daphnia sinensis]
MILNKLAAIQTKMDNEENSQPTRSDPDKITVIDTVDDLMKFEVSLQELDNYYAVSYSNESSRALGKTTAYHVMAVKTVDNSLLVH